MTTTTATPTRSLFTKCAHVWGPVAGTYVPAYRGAFRGHGFVDLTQMLGLLYGTSRLHQSCVRCSVERQWSVLGRASLAYTTPDALSATAMTRLRWRNCEHDWTEPRFTFRPPTRRTASLSGTVSTDVVRYVTEGLSTGVQTCRHCHFVRTWTRIGEAEGARRYDSLACAGE